MLAQKQFEYLDEVWGRFPDPQSFDYQLGPFTLRILFTNKALAQKLTRAFEHLKIDPVREPDLSICLWDTSDAKQKIPPLDWDLICKNGYHGYYEQSIYLHYFEHIEALSVLNAKQNKAYYVVRNLNTLPWWVSGSPLQVILHAWLRERGLHLTHTAAIGNEHRAVLLTGKGGSGKSTTALSCLTRGLYYLGEDYCILAPQPTHVEVYSIYQSAKWRPNTRIMFPNYEHCIINPETANSEKALVYYQEMFPAQIKTSLKAHASISLKVGNDEQPKLQKYPPEAALKDLMMSTLMQLPLYHSDSMIILKEVIDKTKNYQLVLGKDIDANVAVIKNLLAEATS